MGSQEVTLAGLHADSLALLMRLELAAGQAGCQAAASRHQTFLAASLDKRRSQAAIWGKTTVTQQRLDKTKLQKVGSDLDIRYLNACTLYTRTLGQPLQSICIYMAALDTIPLLGLSVV